MVGKTRLGIIISNKVTSIKVWELVENIIYSRADDAIEQKTMYGSVER